MTPDEQALLAAVHADPDDDLPRLVYADWLEERGGEADPARAEFIRKHVRLATLDERDPEYDSLDQRCRELLKGHWAAWEAEAGTEEPLPQYRYHYGAMHRGFCDYTMFCDTSLDDPKFLAELSRHTFTDIHLYNLKADSPLLDWPRLRNVRKLSFYCECYERDMDTLRRLIASPALEGLRELDLANSNLSDDDAELITLNPHFANLRSLAVRHRVFGPRFVAALVASPVLHNLSTLSLTDMPLPSNAILSLADAPFFPHLRKLRLDRLKERGVESNDSLIELLTHPRLDALTGLDLRDNNLTDAALAVCGVPVRFPHLAHLVLEGNRLTSETMARILAMPHAEKLVELDLSYNDLRGDWLRQLSRSKMTCLRRLRLERCQLTPGNVEQLASSPVLRSVRELYLDSNPIGDKGVRALARSPHLGQLQVIRLQSCDIGPDGIQTLATAAFAKRISSYDIEGNRVEGEWLIEVGPEYFGWDEWEIRRVQSDIDWKRWRQNDNWPELPDNT